MKVTEAYLKNKKEIEKFLHTFSFSEESEARIRAYIDNPVNYVNDDIKRLFEKYDGENEIVDFRIPLPASIMKQKKKYQKEIYLIMSTVIDCLIEDDQFTFSVDLAGNIVPNVSLSTETISENYFKVKNDKRKVWKYLDSKATNIAKRVYETWLEKKTFRLNDKNEPELYIDLKSNDYGLYTFITVMNEYVKTLGTKKTSLREKIAKFIQNDILIPVTSENHSETINKIATTVIKPFFNIIQEIISAKMLDMNKYKLYLSFNPFDWLLASSGEEWHSCIDMASSYAYGVGMLGMCGCPDWGEVLYTDGSTKTFGGIESLHIVTRSWACYSDANKFQLINWYPKDIRTSVDFSGCEDIKFAAPRGEEKELEIKSKSTWDPITFSNGSIAWIYRDLNEFFLTKEKDKVYFKFTGNSGLTYLYKFNGKIYCDSDGYFDSVLRGIKCGRYGSIWEAVRNGHRAGNFYKIADKTKEVYRCDCCNTEYSSRDELTYIASEDIWVCRRCRDNNYFVCPVCGEYHRFDDDSVEVHNGSSPWEYELWCRDCSEDALSEETIYWDPFDENYYVSADASGNLFKLVTTRSTDITVKASKYNIDRYIEEHKIYRHSDGALYDYPEGDQ